MKKLTRLLGSIALIGTTHVYSAPLTTLVGNWHLDEERGQRAFDSAYFARHGQFGSTPVADVNDPIWTLRRFDTAALRFDGVNDYVKVPFTPILEPRHISVEAWVRATDPGVLKYIVAKSATACHAAAYSLETENNALTFHVAKGDGVTVAMAPAVAGSIIWNGKWHHVVGTFNEKEIRLFVDGNEIGSAPAGFTIDYAAFPKRDLYIGDYDGDQECAAFNYNFPGDIDEVRVWRKALTPAEVKLRYQGD